MYRLSRFRCRRRLTVREWWAYFGSYGDDFFGDDVGAGATGSLDRD